MLRSPLRTANQVWASALTSRSGSPDSPLATVID